MKRGRAGNTKPMCAHNFALAILFLKTSRSDVSHHQRTAAAKYHLAPLHCASLQRNSRPASSAQSFRCESPLRCFVREKIRHPCCCCAEHLERAVGQSMLEERRHTRGKAALINGLIDLIETHLRSIMNPKLQDVLCLCLGSGKRLEFEDKGKRHVLSCHEAAVAAPRNALVNRGAENNHQLRIANARLSSLVLFHRTRPMIRLFSHLLIR